MHHLSTTIRMTSSAYDVTSKLIEHGGEGREAEAVVDLADLTRGLLTPSELQARLDQKGRHALSQEMAGRLRLGSQRRDEKLGAVARELAELHGITGQAHTKGHRRKATKRLSTRPPHVVPSTVPESLVLSLSM